ncbi:uncharacterized protein F5Z01DRAFT_219212 [Emericellopsis atlantica]|uniref:Uncharacterized protein n=1 Tax=Emericellopsis atlantica TaxID=2614577 RepID=A0A9P7ZIM4_9HYPO|nr:uncharacterized protein F5Z01DRAFT_219212 [Emericellopsis atlantica]KAG9252596.1 hypothetical protein F5Z01DRAFT_219212 [Emericellopsis atlantica]
MLAVWQGMLWVFVQLVERARGLDTRSIVEVGVFGGLKPLINLTDEATALQSIGLRKLIGPHRHLLTLELAYPNPSQYYAAPDTRR